MKKEKSEEQRRLDAEAYCAKAERSPQEVTRWLMRRDLSREQIAVIMSHLTEQGFINERRYISLYASDKLRFNGWGPYKIKFMLYEMGLDRELVNALVPQVMEEEGALDILRGILQRRIENLDEATPDQIERKVIQWAVNRGFSLKDVYAILKELQAE